MAVSAHDSRLHVVRDAPTAFVLVGPDGFVLVDPPAQAQAILDAARVLVGGREAAVVVLDADPARGDTLRSLAARGVPLVATPAIARHLDVATDAREGAIDLAGLAMRLEPVGPARTPADAVLVFGDALLVGDLVAPGRHPDLSRADPAAWLAALDAIAARRPAVVLPEGALDAQRTYLRALVEALAAATGPPEEAARQVYDRMVAAFPDLADRGRLSHALPALLRE